MIEPTQIKTNAFKSIHPRKLLVRYGLKPDKSLGQNFLFDRSALQKIIRAAKLSGDETVLEVGAGLGSLTRHLASASGEVIAVEFDRRLIPALQFITEDLHNVSIIEGDILKLNIGDLVKGKPYLVVANIPYNLTSKLIRLLLETPRPAENIILTIQKEVAERIVPRKRDLSLLSLSVSLYAISTIRGSIAAGSFYPKPSVDSRILEITPYKEPIVDEDLIPTLFKMARAAFNQKRKQIKNSLCTGLGVEAHVVEQWLLASGIEPSQRPQTVQLEQWASLAGQMRAST